jgi:hypothetical protein
MYLRQQWTDSRLQYNASEMLKQIELDNAIKTEIWVPDLSFMTDMDTKFHEVTVPNKMMLKDIYAGYVGTMQFTSCALDEM